MAMTLDGSNGITHPDGLGVPAKTGTRSRIRLRTANGYGSTNTKIRRFTNAVENVGTDITYADSSTLGASFTINVAGVYAISYSDQFSAAEHMGISIGATGTTNLTGLTDSQVLAAVTTSAAGSGGNPSWTGWLDAGSVIRPHTNGGATGTTTAFGQFCITRIN